AQQRLAPRGFGAGGLQQARAQRVGGAVVVRPGRLEPLRQERGAGAQQGGQPGRCGFGQQGARVAGGRVRRAGGVGQACGPFVVLPQRGGFEQDEWRLACPADDQLGDGGGQGARVQPSPRGAEQRGGGEFVGAG